MVPAVPNLPRCCPIDAAAMLGGAAAIAAVLVAAPSAAAQDYPARQVGDWTVAPSKDGSGCFISREFARPGHTSVLLGVGRDGSNHLSVLNENWSIRPQDRLKLTFRLSQGGYPDHLAIGIAADGKQGFVAGFDGDFPAAFAGSRALHVDRGDTPVERLPLDGSGAAVAELRRCVDAQHGPVRASETGDDGIPRDPFAPVGKREGKRR